MQIEILENTRVLRGGDFSDWLRDIHKVSEIEGGTEPKVYAEICSEPEFIDPPLSVAKEMYQTSNDISTAEAARPEFWGYIVLSMIKKKLIKPCFLMEGQLMGEARIDKVLKLPVGDERNKQIDLCVRSFLRRLCTLPEARGSRGILQDCSPSRVWWQHHIASEVSNVVNHSQDDVLRIFRNKQVWRLLSDKMASRLTVIGEKNLFHGIIWRFLEESEGSSIFTTDGVTQLLKRVGNMSSWRCLGALPPERVRDIVAQL